MSPKMIENERAAALSNSPGEDRKRDASNAPEKHRVAQDRRIDPVGEVFIRAASEDGKARLFRFGEHRVAREGVEVPAQRGDAARTQNLPPAGETGRQQRPRRARPRPVRRDAAVLHAVGQIAADDVEAAFAEEPRRVRAVAADNGQPAGVRFERVLVGGETEIPAERAETLFFFERVLEARRFRGICGNRPPRHARGP